MKVLLVGFNKPNGYQGVFLNNVKCALDSIGIKYETTCDYENIENYKGFDLYFGVGDELFRRKPAVVAKIKSIGGIAIDFRTKMLPNKPKTLIKHMFQSRASKPNYVFTHMRDFRKNTFYVGQGLDPQHLYPEQDDFFTVLVDHYMPKRRAKVQEILEQCKTLYGERQKVRIWYHNHNGIEENIFVESRQQYKSIPFDQLSSYYRKTHIFLPTHRETQGIVAAEVGCCGGLTLLEPWMYPKQTIENIPHEFYTGKIKWPKKVNFEANRAFAMQHYSVKAFGVRLKDAIDQIKQT